MIFGIRAQVDLFAFQLDRVKSANSDTYVMAEKRYRRYCALLRRLSLGKQRKSICGHPDRRTMTQSNSFRLRRHNQNISSDKVATESPG